METKKSSCASLMIQAKQSHREHSISEKISINRQILLIVTFSHSSARTEMLKQLWRVWLQGIE